MASCAATFDDLICELGRLARIEDRRERLRNFLRNVSDLMMRWMVREKTFVLKCLFDFGDSQDPFLLNLFIKWCVNYCDCNEQFLINETIRGDATLTKVYKALTKDGVYRDMKWTGVALKNHPDVLWRGLMSGRLASAVENKWIEHAQALVRKDVRHGVTFDVLSEEELARLPNYTTFQSMREYKAKMIGLTNLKLTLRAISNKAPECTYKGARWWSIAGNEVANYTPHATLIGQFLVGESFSVDEDMAVSPVNWIGWMAKMPDKGRGYFLDFPKRTFVMKPKKKRSRKSEGGGAAEDKKARA